jgi:DNA-binding Xre family transcriptional regulator
VLPARVVHAAFLVKSPGGYTRELTYMTIAKVELLRLGRRIKAFRQMLGRKQKDFCERCGLERSHFDEIERGERNVTFSNLCQICEGLNCDIAAVTEGIPNPADAPKQAI